MKVSTLVTGAFAGAAMAQSRPANTSMCDYYTTALLKTNNATNQYTLLTALVNTVVVGSTLPKPNLPGVTFPKVDAFPGILAPNATFMGKGANLLPFFDGGLASSNRGGMPVAINFLDDGGAAPLEKLMPANGKNSHQYTLLVHLYEFFGALLMCSTQGKSDAFPAYAGVSSMYEVHKYMALNSSQVGFFISQVGAAAASFGVTNDDVTAVGKALTMLFDVKCGAKTPITGQPELQSICITDDCTQAANASCGDYEDVVQPGVAMASLAMGLGNASSTATMAGPAETSGGSATTGGAASTGSSTSSSSSSSTSAAAAVMNVGSILAAGGMAAFAFFL